MGSRKVGLRARPWWMYWLGAQAALKLWFWRWGGGGGPWHFGAVVPLTQSAGARHEGSQSAPHCLQLPQPQGAAVLAGTPSPGTWEACKLQTGGQVNRELEGEGQVGAKSGEGFGLEQGSQIRTQGSALASRSAPHPHPTGASRCAVPSCCTQEEAAFLTCQAGGVGTWGKPMAGPASQPGHHEGMAAHPMPAQDPLCSWHGVS